MTKDEAKFIIDRYFDEIEVDGKIFLDKECVLDLIDKIDNTNGQCRNGCDMYDFVQNPLNHYKDPMYCTTSPNPYANTCPYTSSDTKN